MQLYSLHADVDNRWLHHKIIHQFRPIRRPGRLQFAVLLLRHRQHEATALVLKPPMAWRSPSQQGPLAVSPYTPNLYAGGPDTCPGDRPALYPPIKAAVTYLAVGTNGGTEHSEKILMEAFDRLWSNFRNCYEDDPVEVILYTWILPCPECTSLIIEILGREKYSGAKKRLVFTDTGDNLPYIRRDKTIEELKEAHFSVYIEMCKGKLTIEQCLALKNYKMETPYAPDRSHHPGYAFRQHCFPQTQTAGEYRRGNEWDWPPWQAGVNSVVHHAAHPPYQTDRPRRSGSHPYIGAGHPDRFYGHQGYGQDQARYFYRNQHQYHNYQNEDYYDFYGQGNGRIGYAYSQQW